MDAKLKEIYDYCSVMTQGPDEDPLWAIMKMIDADKAKTDSVLWSQK